MGFRALLALSGCGYVSARSLYSSKPADASNIIQTTYPLGNGRLGAMPVGVPNAENLVLNLDSLWSGGPFQNSSYTGGNPSSDNPKYTALPDIRDKIFKDGTGDVNGLLGSNDYYGTYQVLGTMVVAWDGFSDYSDYNRTLDLATGVHTAKFSSGGNDVTTTTFCSYADQVCVWSTLSTGTLPKVTISLQNTQVDSSLVTYTCENSEFVRLSGVTQKSDPEGLRYQAIAYMGQGDHGGFSRTCDGNKMVVQPDDGTQMVTVVVAAGSDFDQTKGNADNSYSFKGEDPGNSVQSTARSASGKHFSDLWQRHLDDFTPIMSKFSLNLPDPKGSAKNESADIISAIKAEGDGDPFLDGLLFDYSRYLLISSSRDNSLPANLQGRWTEQTNPSWSADYHANINLQMNYWPSDQTGLTDTLTALWNYISLNWVPRGTETAKLLYNATAGWVTHDEMNVFGHTAMKDAAQWGNYPLTGAWMMQHVWNYYDYTQDEDWLKNTGYPLIKGVAQFWLSQLQQDGFSKDGTLVVNPCNSPEQGPTTFGCTHYQQEIHHVLNNVIAGASIVGESDTGFVNNAKSALSSLDKGFHVTNWGGVKEWKIPDSYGYDIQNNTHRHLSLLTGWFPGWSIASYLGGYTNSTIQSAVQKTLVSRGNGNGADANSGWEKIWRSAAWARLNNTDQAYYELKYTIEQNIAPNGLSMYSGKSTPFQIDANFGFGGATLSMLSVDLPLAFDADTSTARKVVLGPAIPPSWGGGSVKGLRVRGGGVVDFEWDSNGLVTKASISDSKTKVTLLNKSGAVLAEA